MTQSERKAMKSNNTNSENLVDDELKYLGAWNTKTQEYVWPRQADKTEKNNYVCPSCDESVIPVQGKKRAWHFRHKKDSDCVHYGESDCHKDAKLVLKTLLKQGIKLNMERTCCEYSCHNKIVIPIDNITKDTTIVDEYGFSHNGNQRYADLACINKNPDDHAKDDILYMFEIYHTHKTEATDRPNNIPWFEIEAYKFITMIRKKETKFSEITIPCIRRLSQCESCIIKKEALRKKKEELQKKREQENKEIVLKPKKKPQNNSDSKNNKGRSFKLLEFVVKDVEPQDNTQEDSNDDSDDAYSFKKTRKCNKQFTIQMFGINEKGKTCSITINDYCPFFYVKVGINWNIEKKLVFLQHIKNVINGDGNYYDNAIVDCKLIRRKKLYGFDGGKKHNFIMLKMKNMQSYYKVRNLWDKIYENNGVRMKYYKYYGEKLDLYEANIPPLLRFFHIKEISPSGWISINNKYLSHSNSTTCTYDYVCPKKGVVSLPKKETIVPYKICSFDIEASSSHGDFPLPQKSYKKVAANLIEEYDKYAEPMMINTDEKIKEYISDALLIAFGFGETDGEYKELENIDKVYIKSPEKYTIEQCEQDINTLLESTIDKCNNSKMVIEDMFASAFDEDDEYSSKYENKSSINRHRQQTLVDILKATSAMMTLDEKVNQINQLLSNVFPSVKGDKVTFIGSTFTRYGEPNSYLNHCIALDTCDSLPDIGKTKQQIDSYKTEKEVLLAWTKLIQKENPDIIIGYNIFGFDYKFMFMRAQETGCAEEFLSGFSRNRGEICGKRDKETKKLCIEESGIVIASGQHDLNYIKMPGRLQIDLYNYFRRSVNLESYKLDYVSGYFIGDSVKQIINLDNTNSSTFRIYSKNLAGLKRDDYINFEEIDHTVNKFNEGEKFQVKSLGKNDKGENYFDVCGDLLLLVESSKKKKWCLAKDDVTPQDIFRLTNQGSSERAIVAKYCIQDCNLVYELLKKIDIITEFVEMSKLCSVPIDFLVMRGQGIKLTSFIAKKCREKETLMPVLDKPDSDSGYEGAIVLEPKTGLYLEDPVACVDYSSLYPSSMISENLCHSSKAWTKEYDLDGNLIAQTGTTMFDSSDEYNFVDITHDTFGYERKTSKSKAVKVKTGTKTCRFAEHKNGIKAIIPSVLQELLAARKATKKQMKNEEDPFMKNVLDKRQLSIKLTANSLYGGTGAKTSSIYEPDVAASTTAVGRKLLTYGKRFIEEVYGDCVCDTKNYGKVRSKAKYIYGDTDSVFFCFYLEELDGTPIKGQKALEITIELAQQVGELASSFLKNPHDLEYEKTFLPFCLLSKKRYVGMLYELDPNVCYRKSMGIVLKRRDNAPIVKDIYGGIIDILMNDKNVNKSIEFLKSSLHSVVNGECKINKLVITKSLRSFYKNPSQIPHKVLADRVGERDPGNRPRPGDRIPFAYIMNERKNALQGEKIELPTYIIENKLAIDYAHYITNQIMKPILQIYALILYDLPGYKNKDGKIRRFKRNLNTLRNQLTPEKYQDKEEKLKTKEVQKMLFDDYIKKCKELKRNTYDVSGFF